jgi:predicted permease
VVALEFTRMALFLLTFLQICPVFIVVMLGYLLRRTHLFEEGFTRNLSRFVYYVTIPPLMFQGIAKTDLAFAFDAGVIFSSLCVLCILAVLTFAAASIRRLPPSQRGVLTQGACRSNLVFVGLAVFVNLYGQELLSKAAVFIAFQAFGINVLVVFFLLLPHHSLTQGESWLRLGREAAINPVIMGSAVGMLFSALHWRLPGPLDQTFEWIAQTALPLAMLTVGASLESSRIRDNSLLVSVSCFLKLILLPALTMLVLCWAGIRGESLAMAVILFASPTAVISYILTKEMKGDEDLASAIVMATTVLSPLTMTLWVVLLRALSSLS